MTFSWPQGRQARLAARVLLTIGSLLPYCRLLTFQAIFVTDDYFASDIFNGELPGRVLIGRLLRHGQWPVWTTQLCSGLPLAGSPADPIGLAAFTLFPPAAALDLYVVILLLVAAHGAFALARRFDADLIGAVLAGIAFAGCGYIACQLKHLAIVSTIVWLPVGLLLIDRVFDPRVSRRRLAAALFGLVFAQQVLAGFPQSSYICALLYGSFALFRALAVRRLEPDRRTWQGQLALLTIAIVLGAAAGAVVLLPLSQLGSVSDRADALGWEWATRLAYWPPNLWQFVFPYANGDIANNSYDGPPFFWEDYGYVGILTFIAAIYGGVRERKRPMVLFAVSMTLLAMLFVMGRATPVFRVAYLLIPGMKLFRFPTRFLIVVELGLALLAAIGVTRLRQDLLRRWPASVLPAGVASALVALTMLDLFVHQPRQNPMVDAREWLAPPHSVEVIRADSAAPRTFTPRHRDFHREAFQRAHGWSDVAPYFALREVLEPNTGGGFWNTPSADCYAGISARWSIDVWGDHNREQSIAALLTRADLQGRILRTHPVLPNVLRTFGVTHVLSPVRQQGAALTLLREDPNAFIYRVEGSARTRFVASGTDIRSDKDAVARLIDSRFDPDREVLLHDAAGAAHASAANALAVAGSQPAITEEDAQHLVVSVNAPVDGFLYLADTFYPGWTATVDGRGVPVLRANLAARAVPVPAGQHQVRFTYDPPGFVAGWRISAVAMAALLLWTAASARVPAIPRSRSPRTSGPAQPE